MTLVMIVDALREMGVENIRLTMPYIPYARQDRVCNNGEAFSIRAFANIINMLEFVSVVVWDAHSLVSTALIKNCINIPQDKLVLLHKELIDWMLIEPIYLVAPDAGSVIKTRAIAAMFPVQIKGVLYAEKVREMSTGKIIATRIASQLPDDFGSSRILICDDIIDGGRTFIELAKVLNDYNPKELGLYATHGIFSQGKGVLLKNSFSNLKYSMNCTGLFDNVWCSLDFTSFK
jgi:ribose-phosphate pyrophosphokinase